MATLRISRRAIAAALAPVVLAGGILAPLAGAQQAHTDTGAKHAQADTGAETGIQAIKATRGFDIRNYTSSPLKLVRFERTRGGDIGAPPVGSVIAPGESQHFEASWKWPYVTEGLAWYSRFNDKGNSIGNQYVAKIQVDDWGYPSIAKGINGNYEPFATNWSTTAFTDESNTQITVGGEQWQKQANILKGLCDNGDATCTFEPTSESHVLTDDRFLPDYGFTNPYDHEVEYTFEAQDSVSESNSLEITASEKFGLPKWLASAEVTLSQKYGHVWNNGHSYKFSFKMPRVPPKCTVTPTHKAPMLKYTGNFTVKLGKTTWHLNDVTWLMPDETKDKRVGSWSYVLTPATDEELADAKAHPAPGIQTQSDDDPLPICG